METLIRCNNCGHLSSEEDLSIFKDEDGFFKGCINCETDEYLMDLDIPDEINNLLNNYSDSYYKLEWLKQKVEAHGFTFDYDLNGEISNLRKND